MLIYTCTGIYIFLFSYGIEISLKRNTQSDYDGCLQRVQVGSQSIRQRETYFLSELCAMCLYYLLKNQKSFKILSSCPEPGTPFPTMLW